VALQRILEQPLGSLLDYKAVVIVVGALRSSWFLGKTKQSTAIPKGERAQRRPTSSSVVTVAPGKDNEVEQT